MGQVQAITGRKKPSGATLEIEERKLIVVTSVDFEWDTTSVNSYFKIVTAEDCLLNVLLAGETELASAAANATAYGYYPFPKGEGSNAKVVKVYKDAGNTIGGAMWAVR